MSDAEASPSPPQGKSPRPRRLRWFIFLVLAVAGWSVFMLRAPEGPSVTLPDGSKVTCHGSSTGVLLPMPLGGSAWAHPSYKHSVPEQDDYQLQRAWQKLRGHLPGWLVSRMPAWDYHEDSFPNWTNMHQRELHLRIFGDFTGHPWDIFVVDDHGWETQVYDYIWGDDGRFERGAPQHSGWVRLGSAYPLHSKTLRLRFHPSERLNSKLSPEERSATYTELVVENPFYQGPPSAKGIALPVTKPFRGGTMTLEKVIRDSVVGDDYGSLEAVFSLEHEGKPRESFSLHDFDVTDGSGQIFRATAGHSARDGGRYTVGTSTAPWGDDNLWKLRFYLRRQHYSEEADPAELFHFENLPLPSETDMPLNRELTRNGITLRLTTLSAVKNGETRITIEGWTGENPRGRNILLHRASDDQGRTKTSPSQSPLPLVTGRVGGDRNTSTFAVRLPTDAKSWNLSIIPETITEVEFEVQPPTVAGPALSK